MANYLLSELQEQRNALEARLLWWKSYIGLVNRDKGYVSKDTFNQLVITNRELQIVDARIKRARVTGRG